MAEFHFLRPHWLLALPFALLVLWQLARRGKGAGGWAAHCDAWLVPHVIETFRGSGRFGWLLLVGVTTATVLALAGPTWDRHQGPSMRPAHTRVIVLDVSLSMNVRDVAPSRMQRARDKVAAIMERSRGIQIGVVIFAGVAFPIAPLTTDVATLAHHLGALDTDIIPIQGSRPDLGLEEAGFLLERGGALSGEVILVSDGYTGRRAAAQAEALQLAGFPVSVLAVGTAEGGRIPVREREWMKSLNGEVVVAPTYLENLREIAARGGGRFAEMGEGDDDLDRLLLDVSEQGAVVEDAARRVAGWQDRGPWIVLALLPLAALAFRRGWLLGWVSAAALLLGALPPPAEAAWYDFLRGPDFRAAEALAQGDHVRALSLARDPRIAGAALYRAGQFAPAAAAFAERDDPVSHYNRGNALARLGRYAQSLAAYERALLYEPHFADARHNREIVARLLERDPSRGDGTERSADGAGSGEGDGAGRQSVGRTRDETSLRPSAESGSIDTSTRFGELDETKGRMMVEEPGRPVLQKTEFDPFSPERLEQWLEDIPDDPATLLRQKFAFEFEKRRWRRDQLSDAW